MSGFDAHKKHIFDEVKKLGIPYMIEWLDEVKHIRKHTHKNIKYGFVYNPFNDVDDELELDVYPETGKYAIILEWCVKNIPDYDFKGIPLPYGCVLPRKSVRRASAASAASSAKPDETEFILKWLKDPSRDENGNPIDVALYEGSKYYKLYNSSFTYLYELHNPEKTPLTKKLYKKIQGSLPKTHIYEFDIKDSDTGTGAIAGTIYTYDHLMMKCISERVRFSDEEAVDYKFFMTEYDIFEEIFLIIENLLKNPTHKTKDIKTLLISHVDMYWLYYIYTERMFKYVAHIKLFDKKLLHLNGRTLEETYKTIEIDKIKIKIYNSIISNCPQSMYSDKTIVEKYKRSKPIVRQDDDAELDGFWSHILNTKKTNEEIVKFIKTAIYDISDLYEEAKVNVDEYLPISEDQSITAPLYPSPPRMNNDVTRYKMLMAQIKLLKSNTQESNGKKKEDYETDLEEYNKRIVVFDTPEFKAVLKDYETKARLYKLDVQKYERDLKKYKKDVLGKHGKYGKYAKNSHSPTRVLPFTPVEKRAYRSLSLSKKSASQSSAKTAKGSPKKTSVNHVSNCVNDNDPLTQEPFEDMSEKTLKYLSKIPTIITTADNEKKEIITCYDTVSLYNYILSCYYKNVVPDNIGMGRGSLTLDDMNQVKRKIKHFTTILINFIH